MSFDICIKNYAGGSVNLNMSVYMCTHTQLKHRQQVGDFERNKTHIMAHSQWIRTSKRSATVKSDTILIRKASHNISKKKSSKCKKTPSNKHACILLLEKIKKTHFLTQIFMFWRKFSLISTKQIRSSSFKVTIYF